MSEILRILSEDAKATPAQIATLLGRSEEDVAREIKDLEDTGVIKKYITLVNWEKLEGSYVFAVIELKVALQRKTGYDSVAERISRFSEVESLRLISGDYDLQVTVKGKSMRDVAFFVAEKLASIDRVQSTSTHFLLKKYKEDGVIFELQEEDRRLAVAP